MTNWQVIALILVIAVIVLIAYVIPMMIQLRRSLKKVGDMAENLDRHLPNILSNVESISTDLSSILSNSKGHVDTLGVAAGQLKDMVSDISGMEKRVRNQVEKPLVQSIATVAAVARAAQAFISVYNGKSNGKR